MSIDECFRLFSYAVLVPGFSMVGVLVWNATVMPKGLRRPVAVLLWLQGSIYCLIMVGLLMLRLSEPSRPLLLANTALLVMQAITIAVVIVRVYRNKATRVSHVFMATILTLFVGGKND